LWHCYVTSWPDASQKDSAINLSIHFSQNLLYYAQNNEAEFFIINKNGIFGRDTLIAIINKKTSSGFARPALHSLVRRRELSFSLAHSRCSLGYLLYFPPNNLPQSHFGLPRQHANITNHLTKELLNKLQVIYVRLLT